MTRSSDIDEVDEAPGAFPALEDAAEIFGLLSDPGRLRMLVALLDGEASVGVLAASAGLSESSASHALRLLRAHRIVQPRRQGRMVHYRLADTHVRQLLCVALEHAQHGIAVEALASAALSHSPATTSSTATVQA
jgi:ArsR family transcriptional regulator, lead/cadmium/zinc/bismuth-responsive transcriptional repressor